MQMSAVWFYVTTDVPKNFSIRFFVTKRIFYFSRENFVFFLKSPAFSNIKVDNQQKICLNFVFFLISVVFSHHIVGSQVDYSVKTWQYYLWMVMKC